MPRFFFHSEDGHLLFDSEGTELTDAAAARVEGVRLAGAILSERQQALWETSKWRLLVTDEASAVVFTISVSTELGVAGLPWPRPAR